MYKRDKRNKRIMQKFKKFLKDNYIWCIIGTAIYWAVPHIVTTILGLFINRIFFAFYPTIFAAQVALPAIPIIIGISLGIKGLFALFHKKK